MTYIVDGVAVIVGYNSDGNVISFTFPYDTDTAGMPLVVTITPGVTVAAIEDTIRQLIALLGLK